MLKEKFEVREHVVTERLLIEQRRFCDVCCKEIEHLQYYWTGSITNYTYGDCIENDFDACSEECLKEKINEYCEMSIENSNYEIDVSYHQFRRKV
jgi:hypothetical protein